MQTLRIVILCVSSFFLSSCAALMTHSEQYVGISSYPAQATVVVDGEERGQTPMILDSRKLKESTRIQLKKNGHQPAKTELEKKMNLWVLGNVIAGGPIGLVVDIASKHLKKPENRFVMVDLTKEEQISYTNRMNPNDIRRFYEGLGYKGQPSLGKRFGTKVIYDGEGQAVSQKHLSQMVLFHPKLFSESKKHRNAIRVGAALFLASGVFMLPQSEGYSQSEVSTYRGISVVGMILASGVISYSTIKNNQMMVQLHQELDTDLVD